MLGKASRKCPLCRQIKPVQYFPKITQEGRVLSKAQYCLTCLKNFSQDDDAGGDEGGSGGKQIQQNRDAKHSQHAIELDAILQRNIEELYRQKNGQDILGRTKIIENQQKILNEEAEFLEECTESDSSAKPENPDYTEDNKRKREKITRLFSITRQFAGNKAAALAKSRNTLLTLINKKNAQATQQNFGIFSHTTNENPPVTKATKDTLSQTLSTESSTLFSQQQTNKSSTTDEIEKLAEVIREAQNIFKR